MFCPTAPGLPSAATRCVLYDAQGRAHAGVGRSCAGQPHRTPPPPRLLAPSSPLPQVYFGLPTPEQRLAILEVHTRRWGKAPAAPLLRQVAACTEGFAGADLRALCTAAVMVAVRRGAPLLLEFAEQDAAAAAVTPSCGPGSEPPGGAAASAAAAAGRSPPHQAAAAAQPPEQQQQQGARQQGEMQQRWQQLLDGIEVLACDWREALSAAPPPCSRRHGLSALAAEAATPLQQQELPLVAGPLRQLLAALHAADLPLPPPAAAAARAAAAAAFSGAQWEGEQTGAAPAAVGSRPHLFDEHDNARLESVLLEYGALRPSHGGAAPAVHESSHAAARSVGSSRDRRADRVARLGDEEELLGRLGRSYAPCRLLLWGEGEQGQEAAAGAVLKLFDGEPPAAAAWPQQPGTPSFPCGFDAHVGDTICHLGCSLVRQPVAPFRPPCCKPATPLPLQTSPRCHCLVLSPCRLPGALPQPSQPSGGGRRRRGCWPRVAGWGGAQVSWEGGSLLRRCPAGHAGRLSSAYPWHCMEHASALCPPPASLLPCTAHALPPRACLPFLLPAGPEVAPFLLPDGCDDACTHAMQARQPAHTLRLLPAAPGGLGPLPGAAALSLKCAGGTITPSLPLTAALLI